MDAIVRQEVGRMKFKGKIDLWLWIVMLAGEATIISSLLMPEGGRIIGIVTLIIYNLIFLPFVIRNYVEISDEKVTVAFGFSKVSIPLSEIVEVYRTYNPISASAASLDRIVIKGRNKQMICAVKDREEFFTGLKERNPKISITDGLKKDGDRKIEKASIIFSIVIFAIVGFILTTGDIEMVYHEPSFTIKASYWYDKEIFYDEIESIEYRDEKISGSRTGGFGSFRLLMGDFRNDEFGNYTRYTYKNCDAGVVLLVDGREVVISGKDKESTREIYEELMERCQK